MLAYGLHTAWLLSDPTLAVFLSSFSFYLLVFIFSWLLFFLGLFRANACYRRFYYYYYYNCYCFLYVETVNSSVGFTYKWPKLHHPKRERNIPFMCLQLYSKTQRDTLARSPSYVIEKSRVLCCLRCCVLLYVIRAPHSIVHYIVVFCSVA